MLKKMLKIIIIFIIVMAIVSSTQKNTSKIKNENVGVSMDNNQQIECNNGKIYICSPYRGDVELNVGKTREYCKEAILKGYIPIAPHIYFTQFLDDNNAQERELAFGINKTLIEECCKLWVCGDHISDGMKIEIDFANSIGIPVVNEI